MLDRKAGMLETRQNPMEVAQAESCGYEVTADWMAEVKSGAFDYAGQMDARKA